MCIRDRHKCQNVLGNPSILRRLGALELELQPVSDKRDELTIGGLPLGIAHRIPKEPLQGIQIAPIPGYLDGVADGTLHPAGGRPEGFRYLGIEYLRDGVAGLRPAVEASRRKQIYCFVCCPIDLSSIGLHI